METAGKMQKVGLEEQYYVWDNEGGVGREGGGGGSVQPGHDMQDVGGSSTSGVYTQLHFADFFVHVLERA